MAIYPVQQCQIGQLENAQSQITLGPPPLQNRAQQHSSGITI